MSNQRRARHYRQPKNRRPAEDPNYIKVGPDYIPAALQKHAKKIEIVEVVDVDEEADDD